MESGGWRGSRREVLRIGGWGLVGLAASAALGGCAVPTQAQGPAGQIWPLNTAWRFGPYSEAALGTAFDDSGFTAVSLPHTVTALSWRDWNPDTWQHRFAYRRHFVAPPTAPGARVFVDFAGVMVDATPTINGHALPLHAGGYLPFTYELTTHLRPQNVLAVLDDSRWLEVPPEGNPGGPASVDYLQPGGIYREVQLRAVPETFIADVFAKPIRVLGDAPAVAMLCTVDAGGGGARGTGELEVEVRAASNGALVGEGRGTVSLRPGQQTMAAFTVDVRHIQLWSPDHPNLYHVQTTLRAGGRSLHRYTVRVGFRDARFEVDGFFLNGTRLKLFGLNRHQIYPYTGMAMPARVQARDATIVRRDLNCNMVRCSHYPQSPHFLDACDELGLMVWEETPGWGYVGDAAWQAICVQNVRDMILRDRNRPSVIIWGTRVNEAPNIVPLWAKTRAICAQLDGSRPSSGTMTRHSTTDWAEDVFAMDDYSYNRSSGAAFLLPPIAGVPYLVTEAVGAIDPPHYYQRTVSQADQARQAYLHGQVHSDAAMDNGYCGLLAWCGFDYDSLNGYVRDDLKWPGVCDTFRVPKLGAAIYQSQVDPAQGAVIQPAFYWDFNPIAPVTSLGAEATIWSNCDRIIAYVDGKQLATLEPALALFPGLRYPPFFLDVSGVDGGNLPELRLDGYVGGKMVGSRRFAADPSGDRLQVSGDDDRIVADGADATRVVFRAVDTYGAPRPYVTGDVTLTVQGPADLIGEVTFPFAANGGVGACWLRSRPGQTGTVTLHATHPTLGSGSVTVVVAQAPATPLAL